MLYMGLYIAVFSFNECLYGGKGVIMRKIRKVTAVGMAVALTVGSLTMSGFKSQAAGLPTTDGHDKYVNSAVFDVISSDTFGTKELDEPLFDKTKGSHDITRLQVPVLAYDDTSIGLVWDKPEKYDDITDYNVYINGVKAGTARENFKVNAAWTAKYMEAFYDYYDKQGNSDVDMVDVDIHSYRATGLNPDTEYTFKVVAVNAAGEELGTAKEITHKTTKTPEVLNIVDFGAVASEGYVTYNDEVNALVEKNTKAIQAAIDACPEGGKVVVPEAADGKVFVSGALWLKSDMTLEVNGTLWSSPNSDHFEIGFLMYPFYTDTRGWGLVNAMSADESNPIKNVRVTGTGKLYGNGWKYGVKDTMYEDGYTSNAGQKDTVMAGDPDVTGEDAEYALPRYMAGNNTKVFKYGIQAADSAIKYLKNVTNEDGTRKYTSEQIDALLGQTSAPGIDSTDIKNAYATRSSLLIMRNCENVYVGDITIENPSNHSVNILDSRNIATNNVKVFSFDGNNADGLGFGCSQDVICWNNFTDTGDDNLGFGSSVGEGARDCDIQTNSEVWMFNNFLREGHGGLAAGSHTGNGIQDVLFEDTVMNHIDMAFRFKSAPTNGGFGANITMRDCAVANTQQGWVMTTSYSDPNSASSTEFAEIGEFYNFASYNISMYGVQNNTIQVLADVDPVGNSSKPWHTHHNLYFQDITFGNVGTNGSYKNKNGWESLIGCENAVFYNFKTVSYAQKAKDKKTDKAWNNLQYCKNIVFQGTTLDVSASREDAREGITTKLNNLMSGINVTDKTVTAEEYIEEVEVPEVPEDQEVAWAKKASEATDFFNDLASIDSGAKTPKYEYDEVKGKDNIGYIWDNTSNQGNTSYPDKLIGYAYKNCDIKDLSKLSLSFQRGGTDGTGKVSVRLDSKTGAEIASAVFDVADKDYHDYVMDVTLPEDTDTSVSHDLYLVFSSTNTNAGQKYIGNAKTLTAMKSASADVNYEKISVDLLNGGNGMVASVPADAGMYGTVTSLETATVKCDYVGETTEKVSVTIDGVTYTDFVQAETAANAGGEVPAGGTATFVFKPIVDCSVTLHSKSTSKVWWFIESPDDANVSNKATAGQINDVMTFNLKADKTYYYYCQGSKPMVYGVYFNAPVSNEDSLLKEETSVDVGGSTEGAAAKQAKLTWTAVDNGSESSVFYGIDTYIGNQKVDTIDGFTGTEAVISRLSAGVDYTFKVYVSEKGDSANSMSTTGWNKTYIGEANLKIEGTDNAAITAPEGAAASTSNSFYTHTQGSWSNISKTDERVRGYKLYVNGELKKTVYNYEIPKYADLDTVSKQIGRLTPGMENAIKVVAFTDAGLTYEMAATATTLENYDYKAPVFAADAKLTATAQANGDVVLTWTAATDDTAVGGYRVYVDGNPVVPEGQREFNPVNGSKTTTETTYTVSGLDLTTEHTFTVQAGDTWWKAAEGMGDFDKMAGFNWTAKGLSVELKAGTPEQPTEPETPEQPTDPETPDFIVDEDAAQEVKGAEMAQDTTVKDEAGNDVTEDIILKVNPEDEATAEALKKELASKIDIETLKDMECYDIYLTTTSGTVVKLENGYVRIKFAYKSGIDMSKHDVVVYHKKDSGELEKIAVTLGTDGFTIDAKEFSSYVVAYLANDTTVEEPTTEQPTTGGSQDSETTDGSVQTGDTSMAAVYMLVAVLALAVAALVYADKRRRAVR